MLNNDLVNFKNIFKTEPFLIVASIADNGNVEYLDFDSRSGGYPYWTLRRKGAHEFKEGDNVAASVSSMTTLQLQHRKIFKVKVVLDPIDIVDISNINKARTVEEIMILDAQIEALQAKRNNLYDAS